MYSFKPKKCGSNVRLSGVLRLFLVLWLGLLAVAPVQAQVYNWKSVAIKGGGFVTGIITHPNAPGLIYARTDIGGAYRWNATNGSNIAGSLETNQITLSLNPTNEAVFFRLKRP